MTSTPAPEATFSPQPVESGWRLPLALYALLGFAELLALQSFTVSLSGGLLCLAGFALGAELARRASTRTRLFAALALGISAVAYSYFGSPVLAVVAAAAMGALFPRNSPQLYIANLGGALAGSLASAFLMSSGPWVCLGIAAAVCVLGMRVPETKSGAEERMPLVASGAAGAMLFALVVIWKHLLSLTSGSSSDAALWTWIAVLLGLLVGAIAKPIRCTLLFECGALLLAAQVVAWDRVPGMSTPVVIFLLLTPPVAVAGASFRRIVIEPAATAMGGLVGGLLSMFVLVPAFGSEVSLKGLVLVLIGLWVVFLLREPLTRRRWVSVGVVGALILIVLLGRWWNWNSFQPASRRVAGVRFLPASLIFKQENVRGGFTTVVEQTSVSGEVAHTVRTLFRNGRFQADDSQELHFVPGSGSALLIGLGTGRGVAELQRLGYTEIVVAEVSEGVVKAAAAVFGLKDARLKVELEDGRGALLDAARQYDLIAIDGHAVDLDTREFYALAHSRLRAGGALQQSIPLDRISPREVGSQAAAARSAFSNVSLWQDAGQVLLVAADGAGAANNLNFLRQYP